MTPEPPAPAPTVLYVDTSAMLKLLVREAESTAIERELLKGSELATSVITSRLANIRRSTGNSVST